MELYEAEKNALIISLCEWNAIEESYFNTMVVLLVYLK